MSNLMCTAVEGDQNKHKLKKMNGVSQKFDPTLLFEFVYIAPITQ